MRGLGHQARELGLAPEEDADVEPSSGGTVEHVEERPAAVGHLDVAIDERDGDPDADLRCLDRLTDAAKGGLAVDQRAHTVSRSQRIGAGAGGGNHGHLTEPFAGWRARSEW